ncbi:MAG: hypothetical protein LBS12_05675 [Prevotellaceae bacterium]|jgi:hypothetical protein|nr:hypothetical protein [Prevotellaceae bacterium]
MKNICKYSFLALLAIVAIAACSPQEFDDDYSMGAPDTITPDQISFTATPSATSPNVVTFTNTSGLKRSHAVVWDLGNGASAKGNVATGMYPMRGLYVVSMSVYAPDGSLIVKTHDLVIVDDDFSLVDSPVYNKLTGGIENTNGKTWVFDQYNNFTQEVKDAVGKDIRGHMGLGPGGGYDQSWWGAGANDKQATELYKFKFTFKQSGTQLIIQNNGKGYGRWACASGQPGAVQDGDDSVFDYAGGNYSFSVDEPAGAYPVLTIPSTAIFGYYACSNTFEIIYQTEGVMALRVFNTTESQDWIFIFCREDLNIAEPPPPPPPPKEPSAVPLFEDFEAETRTVDFIGEDMGALSAIPYQNPAPVPINSSSRVALYQKSAGFYSNLSFTAPDYLFDLTTQNKIRVKVFIPSYNDYTTEHNVAGDWIANRKLLPQLAVKLQDSSLGGNAWQTQTEIVQANLELDKWLDLVFDFSGVATRTDYDKIVVQFGAEGHAGTGIFFFDDFSFDN